jgi:hypothetical protein
LARERHPEQARELARRGGDRDYQGSRSGVARCLASRDRQFLALARVRLGHLFPALIDQSGYNRRLRALAPVIGHCINYLAYVSPSFCDRVRLLDSTPVPCGQSRETVKRSEFAGHAGYDYCRSGHTRAGFGGSGCI